nr:DUF3781 domain-containing protein [Streptococcus constellatus]
MMKEYLLTNLDKFHTTDLGKVRLQKHLLLREENPVLWAKGFIQRSETKISHKKRTSMCLIIILCWPSIHRPILSLQDTKSRDFKR